MVLREVTTMPKMSSSKYDPNNSGVEGDVLALLKCEDVIPVTKKDTKDIEQNSGTEQLLLIREHVISAIKKSVDSLDVEKRYGTEGVDGLLWIRQNIISVLTRAINQLDLGESGGLDSFEGLITLRQDLIAAISQAICNVEQMRKLKMQHKKQKVNKEHDGGGERSNSCSVPERIEKDGKKKKKSRSRISSTSCGDSLEEDDDAGRSASGEKGRRKRRRRHRRKREQECRQRRQREPAGASGAPQRRQRLSEQELRQRELYHEQRWLEIHRRYRRDTPLFPGSMLATKAPLADSSKALLANNGVAESFGSMIPSRGSFRSASTVALNNPHDPGETGPRIFHPGSIYRSYSVGPSTREPSFRETYTSPPVTRPVRIENGKGASPTPAVPVAPTRPGTPFKRKSQSRPATAASGLTSFSRHSGSSSESTTSGSSMPLGAEAANTVGPCGPGPAAAAVAAPRSSGSKASTGPKVSPKMSKGFISCAYAKATTATAAANRALASWVGSTARSSVHNLAQPSFGIANAQAAATRATSAANRFVSVHNFFPYAE